MKLVMGEHGRPRDTICSIIPCWDPQLQHLKRIFKKQLIFYQMILDYSSLINEIK